MGMEVLCVDFAKDFGVGIRRVVAGDEVFEPGDVQGFQGARESNGVLDGPAGAAVEREADLVAEDFLHGFDASDDLLEAALRHEAAIGMGRRRCGVRRTSRWAWRASWPDYESRRPV